MRLLSFLKTLPQAFYSAPFYKNLVLGGRGLGLGFLLVVTLLNVVRLSPPFFSAFSSFLEEKDAFFASLPEMEIKNGLISIDDEGPVEVSFLKTVEGGPFKVVFDMGAVNDNLDRLAKKMDDENIFVLVTKSKIFLYDKNAGKIEVKEAKNLGDMTVRQESWAKTGMFLGSFFFPFLFLSLVLFLFVGHFFSALLGAAVLAVFSPLLKLSLPFGALMRLSSAAKVPGTAVILIANPFPFLQILLWFGFAFFGLLAVKTGK